MNKTIGIIGGGQLGRMLTEAAIKLGFKVVVIDPTENCPAAQVGARQIKASFRDAQAIEKLAELSDFITVESEHINTTALQQIKTKPINPVPQTIRWIQDKLVQKVFLDKNNLPVAPYQEVKSFDEAAHMLDKFGGKLILKSRFDAYDGRGNAVVSSLGELKNAYSAFEGRELYAEQIIPFKKELAVMVAKDTRGNIRSYPAVETLHKRNICVEVYAPAQVSDEVAAKAIQKAEMAIRLLEGAGMYGVEMFLTQENEILINEIAPRVHNSGHYTMDACVTSQFEQHIRAVTGMELGDTSMTVPAAVMVNILGERDGPVELSGVAEAEAIEGVTVHMYGKSPTKLDRKMGHINAIGATIEEARAKARQARKLITI